MTFANGFGCGRDRASAGARREKAEGDLQVKRKVEDMIETGQTAAHPTVSSASPCCSKAQLTRGLDEAKRGIDFAEKMATFPTIYSRVLSHAFPSHGLEMAPRRRIAPKHLAKIRGN